MDVQCRSVAPGKMWFIFALILCMLLIITSMPGGCAEEQADLIPEKIPEEVQMPLLLSCYVSEDRITYQSFQDGNQVTYLYLPDYVDYETLTFTANIPLAGSDDYTLLGDCSFQVNNTFTELELIDSSSGRHRCVIMRSELPCMSIRLGETSLPVILENSKKIKYIGNDVIISENGKREMESNVVLKGRGNYTWGFPKSSFQIKFETGRNLFGLEESNTWLLISNLLDDSLLRNKYALVLAEKMGMQYVAGNVYADLWIDGEYEGNYLVTEKVQIGKNRIDLKDDQAVLVELDNLYYHNEEIVRKSSISESYFVLKDSTLSDTKDGDSSKALQGLNGFMDAMDSFEKALNRHEDWKTVSSWIDVDSFVRMYFLQELAGNSDACRSSAFFYKNGPDDIIHIGPPWDYDISFGNFDLRERGGDPDTDYIANIGSFVDRSSNFFSLLMTYPEFRERANLYYHDTLKALLQEMDQQIDVYKDGIAISAEMDRIKWTPASREAYLHAHTRFGTYAEEVEQFRNWLRKRIKHLDNRYNEDFVEQGIPEVPYSNNRVL